MENTTVAPVAVTETSTTPAAPVTARDMLNDNSIFEIAKASAQPRDEAGKFVADSEGGETVVDEPAAEVSEAAPEVPPSDSTTTEEPAAEPKPERKLAAEFAVFDTEGELEIPDIKLSFKANGKDMKDVPLDRVVKLAQWGAYNEEREQAVRETRDRIPQYEGQIQQQQQQLTAYVEAYRELLLDENAYIQARNEYQAINTPEAQLQRLQAERQQEMQSFQQRETEQRVQAQAQQFVSYLAPKLEALQVQHPTVSFDEVFGRYNLLTAPLLVAGRIPPDRFSQVDHIVESELAPWVESQHLSRATTAKKQTATVADAKRQMARAVAPRGSTPTAPSSPQPQKSYTRATDILADIPAILRSA